MYLVDRYNLFVPAFLPRCISLSPLNSSVYILSSYEPDLCANNDRLVGYHHKTMAITRVNFYVRPLRFVFIILQLGVIERNFNSILRDTVDICLHLRCTRARASSLLTRQFFRGEARYYEKSRENSRDTYLARQTKPESEFALASQFTKPPSENFSTSPNEFEQILTGYPAFRATTEDEDEIRSEERHLFPLNFRIRAST